MGKDVSKLLTHSDSVTRNQAVDVILDERRQLEKDLIKLVDPDKSQKVSPESRAAAAYVLGEIRSIEAVGPLVRSLAFERELKRSFDIDRFDYPITSALIKIGRPSVPELLRRIEAVDSRAECGTIVAILSRVLGGKRRLLDVLRKVEQGIDAKNIDRLRMAIDYVEVNVKERKEPLY